MIHMKRRGRELMRCITSVVVAQPFPASCEKQGGLVRGGA